MHLTALSAVLGACLLAAAGPARADLRTPASAAGCTVPAGDVLRDRAVLRAEFERLPRACLEQLARRCQAAAERTLLGLDEAATCSLGHEALLNQAFDGDYRALMAWWQAERQAR